MTAAPVCVWLASLENWTSISGAAAVAPVAATASRAATAIEERVGVKRMEIPMFVETHGSAEAVAGRPRVSTVKGFEGRPYRRQRRVLDTSTARRLASLRS